MKIIEILTEDDWDGRRMKRLGLFQGSGEQVVQYCLNNHMEAAYNYYVKESEIVDVSGVIVKDQISIEKNGKVNIVSVEEQKERMRKDKIISTALGKLSREERELLELDKKYFK